MPSRVSCTTTPISVAAGWASSRAASSIAPAIDRPAEVPLESTRATSGSWLMNSSRRCAALALHQGARDADRGHHGDHDRDAARHEGAAARRSGTARRRSRAAAGRPATAASRRPAASCRAGARRGAPPQPASKDWRRRVTPASSLPPRPRSASAARREEPLTNRTAPSIASTSTNSSSRSAALSFSIRWRSLRRVGGSACAPNTAGPSRPAGAGGARSRRQREVVVAAGHPAVRADRVGLEARDGAEPESSRRSEATAATSVIRRAPSA